MNYLKNILPLFFSILLGLGLNAQTVSVAGKVNSADGPMPNVTLTIIVGQQTLTTTTDDEGNYMFIDVPQSTLITLKPSRVINPLNGVSTFDLVLGSKHILGLTPFDAADKYIGMDVNLSGSVTVLDLVILRRLILGLISEIPDTDAWRFVEERQLSSIKFDQIEQPEYSTDYPAIDFTPNADGLVILNFAGIKVGDANGSANTDF